MSIESYWAGGRTLEIVERTFAFSYPLGVYEGKTQIAVARIVNDISTFVWLCDVFVDSNFRGRGLGTWLTEATIEWAEKSGVKRIILVTRDAHEVIFKQVFKH